MDDSIKNGDPYLNTRNVSSLSGGTEYYTEVSNGCPELNSSDISRLCQIRKYMWSWLYENLTVNPISGSSPLCVSVSLVHDHNNIENYTCDWFYRAKPVSHVSVVSSFLWFFDPPMDIWDYFIFCIPTVKRLPSRSIPHPPLLPFSRAFSDFPTHKSEWGGGLISGPLPWNVVWLYPRFNRICIWLLTDNNYEH